MSTGVIQRLLYRKDRLSESHLHRGMMFASSLISRGLITLLALSTLCATVPAYAQSTQAIIVSPSGAPTVRIRWPETSLAPSVAGKVVSITDATGRPLPFTFVIAPEDQGHPVHPMWLVVQFKDSGDNTPYRLIVGSDVHSAFVDDIDTLGVPSGTTLSTLPLAMIPATAWGPITATLEEAQNAQQISNTRWRLWILLAVIVVIALLAWIIALFMRHQARREDVTKL